jgi:predicted porin
VADGVRSVTEGASRMGGVGGNAAQTSSADRSLRRGPWCVPPQPGRQSRQGFSIFRRMQNMKFTKRSLAIACSLALGSMGVAHADELSDMKAKLDALQKQIQELKDQMGAVQKKQEQAPPAAAAAPAAPAGGVSMKPGNDLTFKVGGGEVTIYGHADVSLDYQTNGMSDFINGGQRVTGHNSWMPDVSSNLSYFGIRGNRSVSDDLKGLFQFETEVAYAATPGASDQATDGTAQKFSLGSRNSFVGLQSSTYGAIKLGKTDTPYKTSTARLDPFANTPGDYNAIIGNSGGDNRTEFDLRLPHSIWYESPAFNGFNGALLVSPGQNRSTDSGLYAQGEPDCAGGNSTAGLNGPGGQPGVCNDGSFTSAYSLALSYTSGPLYVTLAYELHRNVNRTGDETVPGTVGVRDESAYKIGVQYAFPTNTTVNFELERLKRDAITDALDERTHTASWLAVTQSLTPNDDVNIGWAKAWKTPGQPDQGVQDAGGNAATPGPSDNGANLLDVGYKHRFLDKRTTTYVTYSRLINQHWAHYSLGAGGHGLPTRNYVGDKFVGGCQNIPSANCGPPFAGNTAEAFSVGVTYDF